MSSEYDKINLGVDLKMQIKWIGQAGLLIDTDKFKIMVDPYLSDSVAKINPKNRRRMNNHIDHLDPETLPKFLYNDRMITVLAPHGSWEKVREYGGNHNYVMFNRKPVWTYKNVIFTAVKAEHSDAEWRKDVVNEQLEYSDGYMKIPDRPGLGIEINEDECAKHPYKPHTLRHYTGALTDIRPAKTEFYF